MEAWLRDRLSSCLDFEVPDDMIKYILTLKSSEEFDEYFETLLNTDCEEHRLFLTDCKTRLFSKPLPNKKLTADGQQTLSKKSQGSSSNKQNANVNSQGKVNKQSEQSQGAKKKNKFVSLYTNDGKVMGETILLKGRRHCDCQASQHKLINNCMSCGRIVCEQEGSGPCLFCGAIVCTYEEQQILNSSNAKKANNLLKSLKEKSGGESLKKALEQRDRLLEYDKNSEQRTTVIDDELDYFQENSVWLSEEERVKYEQLKKEMHEKKHGSRINRKIKIDFAGREVNNDEFMITEEYEKKILDEVSKHKNVNSWSNQDNSIKITPDALGVDPNIDGLRPLYKPSAAAKKKAKEGIVNEGLERIYNRVQDKELLEMQDMRQCLSMHQPWASLLVAGIKKHEGRAWYSEHRGRLWIASTVKEPHPEDIIELENFYKKYYDDDSIKFPAQYPTGCLLGCVKVEDCLPQEDYRDLYPNGESDCPYVFICNNPEQLPVVIPIKGHPKIYSIDPKIHNTACKTLLKQRTMKG